MAGAFLTNIDTHERYAERFHAAQGIEQFAVGNNAHAAGLQRLIAGIKWFPQLFVLGNQAGRFRQLLSFQASFQPGLRFHQLGTQFFHQITVRFLRAFRAGQLPQFVGTFDHRQFGNQQLNIFQEQVGGFPAAQQQHLTGNIGGHIRVTVAVTAHPGGKAHRYKVNRQLIVEVLFQLFVQLTQVVWYPFPQAVFNYGKPPFRFINWGRAVLTDFIRMP